MRLDVTATGPIEGSVAVPGDKSISHRALLLAAAAEGESVLEGLSGGDDVRRTSAAIEAIGAGVSRGGLPGDPLVVRGGPGLLHAPAGSIDAGNSGTTMRLLAGFCAGWPWSVEIAGDASLSRRPMDRIAIPLRLMGASIECLGASCLPPLVVRGGRLAGIDYTPPVPSAQVKSAVLLAGLRATGETVVRETTPTRPHTEDLLAAAGAAITVVTEGSTRVIRLAPSPLKPLSLSVPGDPSQAAFWAVAASVIPGSDLLLPGVYTGPGRRGFIDILTRMGAAISDVSRCGNTLGHVSDLRIHGAPLAATSIAASEVSGLDEVPVLAVAAALARGTTTFSGMAELRVKESDRLSGTRDLVNAFGGHAEVAGDDLLVVGVERLHGARFDAQGDHRMAMAAAVAALAAPPGQHSTITGWEAVSTSYPGFEVHLDAVGGNATLDREGSDG